MSLQYRFNEVLDFPCSQNLRIIVLNHENEPQNLIEHINKIIPNACTQQNVLEKRLSQSAKYISFTIKVELPSAEALEKLYAQLPKHEFVKHLL